MPWLLLCVLLSHPPPAQPDGFRFQSDHAFFIAGVAALVGYVPVGFGMPVWVSLILGAGILVGLIFFIGKRAEETS